MPILRLFLPLDDQPLPLTVEPSFAAKQVTKASSEQAGVALPPPPPPPAVLSPSPEILRRVEIRPGVREDRVAGAFGVGGTDVGAGVAPIVTRIRVISS